MVPIWCNITPIVGYKAMNMSRQSISFTDPNSEWLDQKVNVEREYRSKSEAINDLIRKAREIEATRARLIEAEASGFTELNRDEIRADVRE
jgi:antitoxin ParD1/3/4